MHSAKKKQITLNHNSIFISTEKFIQITKRNIAHIHIASAFKNTCTHKNRDILCIMYMYVCVSEYTAHRSTVSEANEEQNDTQR